MSSSPLAAKLGPLPHETRYNLKSTLSQEFFLSLFVNTMGIEMR